jgi:hypothetical protein
MSDSNAEKNKAIVLEAFDTLFNKRDYTTAGRFGRPTTFNTALISSWDETGSSTSSRPRHRRSSMGPG